MPQTCSSLAAILKKNLRLTRVIIHVLLQHLLVVALVDSFEVHHPHVDLLLHALVLNGGH